jgi:hypothetical protein
VRFTRGLGTSAASRARKSNGYTADDENSLENNTALDKTVTWVRLDYKF